METPKTENFQQLPHCISDAAWESLLPFLKATPNIYVGKPENCRRFLSALVWITKEGPPGGPSRKFTAIGTLSIGGSVDGAMRVFSKHSINIFTRQANS